jgi:hypothetical protein
MSGGSSGGQATSTTNTGPPSWIQPYAKTFLNEVFGNTQANLAQGVPSGLNQQVAGFTPAQNAALSFGSAFYPYAYNQAQFLTPQVLGLAGGATGPATSLANQGASTIGGFASGALGSPLNPTLNAFQSGAYTGPNPYLSQYYNQAAGNLTNQYALATQPALAAQFQQAGAFNSPGYNQAQGYAQYGLGQSLGTLGANIYEPAYQQGMANQLAAAQAAQQNTQFNTGNQLNAAISGIPSAISSLYQPASNLSNLGYGAIGQLGAAGNQALQGLYGVGSAQQQQEQNVLNAAQANAAQGVNWPYAILAQLGGALGQASLGGGQTTSTGPAPSSGGGGIFGK